VPYRPAPPNPVTADSMEPVYCDPGGGNDITSTNRLNRVEDRPVSNVYPTDLNILGTNSASLSQAALPCRFSSKRVATIATNSGTFSYRTVAREHDVRLKSIRSETLAHRSSRRRPIVLEQLDWITNPHSVTTAPPTAALENHLARTDMDATPSLTEFPRENLVFVRSLGEGQFGEVLLCKASIPMDDEYFGSREMLECFRWGQFEEDTVTSRQIVLVVVKTLRINATEQMR